MTLRYLLTYFVPELMSDKRVVIQTPDGHEYNINSVLERDNRIVLSARAARDAGR